jgi:hypothetical protein
MRTTLTIGDDVLAAAKALADRERKTIGQVVSELARQPLRRPVAQQHRNGVPLLPVSNPDAVVTLQTVNALRDDAPRPGCWTATS